MDTTNVPAKFEVRIALPVPETADDREGWRAQRSSADYAFWWWWWWWWYVPEI